jgi:hypothetical protein
MNKFTIGDKVAYSIQFLASIGMPHSDMSRARGIVQSVKIMPGGCPPLICVSWDNPDMPEKVIASNLANRG